MYHQVGFLAFDIMCGEHSHTELWTLWTLSRLQVLHACGVFTIYGSQTGFQMTDDRRTLLGRKPTPQNFEAIFSVDYAAVTLHLTYAHRTLTNLCLKESSRQRPRSAMSRKTPGEVRARTCGTKSPSPSEALRFIDSSKSPNPNPAIWPSSIRTEDPTCANHVDVLTV